MTNNQAKKLYKTGRELLSYGKPREAINYFREAVEANPFCMEAQLELGYLLGVMENYGEALDYFNNALKIEKTFPALFGKGICLFFMEDYEKSADAFIDAREFGENEDLWYYLGSIHLIHSGNCEDAVDCFDIALSINENFIEAWNDCGVAHSILKNDATALIYFDGALKILSDFGALETESFGAEETLEICDFGATNLKDLLVTFPTASKSEISKALNIDLLYDQVIYNMGATLADMGRYEESLKYLDQTLESEPDNFKALFYMGNVMYFMEKEEKAIEYFIKALKVDKNQEELWNYLGYIQFSLGQNYEAVESLNEAIKLNNEFETAYMNLGNVYLALDRNDLALDCFERVLEISPDNEEALETLSRGVKNL